MGGGFHFSSLDQSWINQSINLFLGALAVGFLSGETERALITQLPPLTGKFLPFISTGEFSSLSEDYASEASVPLETPVSLVLGFWDPLPPFYLPLLKRSF